MESTGSRSDFQKEDRKKKKQAFFLCLCMRVIDNGSGIEILREQWSESWMCPCCIVIRAWNGN